MLCVFIAKLDIENESVSAEVPAASLARGYPVEPLSIDSNDIEDALFGV